MLKTRVLTAIALLPVVLGMLFLAGPTQWALFAAAIALLVFVPLALIQDAAMDRTGLPPALESP